MWLKIIVFEKERGDKIVFSESFLGKLSFKYTGVQSHILKLVTVSLIKFPRWTLEILRFFTSNNGIHRDRLIDKFLVNLSPFLHFFVAEGLLTF